MTVKLTDVAPLGTAIVAGTVAAPVLVLDNVRVLCAAVPAAVPFKVTVAVELVVPPTTLVGFKITDVTNNGFTESVAVADPFNVAVITGLVTAVATREVTVTVAVVAPAATVTLAGTVAAAGILLDSATVLCEAVPTAGAFNVTVAVEFVDPPNTLVGFRVSDNTPGGGVTVSTAPWLPPFSVPEIFAALAAATARLVTLKLADVAPAFTVTVAGTVAAARLPLESVTVLCAVVPAAGPFNVTVPVAFVIPPETLGGFKVRDTIDNGLTVSVAVADPFNVAVITGLATAVTTRDVTVNVAVVAPAATVTLAGTVAAVVMLLNSVTVLCAAVPTAGVLSVTVAVEFADPPKALIGFSVSDATPCGGVTVSTAPWVVPFSVPEIFAVPVAAIA